MPQRAPGMYNGLALAWLVTLLLCLAARTGFAEEAPADTKKAVTLHDNVVFYLRAGGAGRSLDERVNQANRGLAAVVKNPRDPDVRVHATGDVATVLAGDTPIVELVPEDARRAGDASLANHAARIASLVRAALDTERRRASAASTVFSISLVVFFGLITVYLVERTSRLAGRARSFVAEHPGSIPALRLKSLDVVGSASVRNAVLVLLSFGRFLAVLGLAYTWLVLSLSLFDATRPYTEKLTGIVLSPLTSLVGRIASALPLFAVVIAAALVVAFLIRFSDLFFQSVSRGETRVGWLAAETALAAGLMVRVVITLFALIVVGPVITGHEDGALSRTGLVLLIAVAAAAVPALASVVAGLCLVFSRAFSLGDDVEYGGERGRVRNIGVLSVVLDAEDGGSVRVPHARSLWHPTRVHGRGAA